MNPIRNPFAPGAGTPPPELAGRDALLASVHVAIERARIGRPAKSVMLVGLRGVGKTVLLDRMRDAAEGAGIHTIRIEAPEGRSLPALLAPQLRQALLRLSQLENAKALAIRGLRALAGFAKGLKVTYHDIEVGIDHEPEPGLADNGDLEHDLQALMEQAGLAAQAAGTALALFIDELQYVPEAQLSALITALHRTEQRRLPVVLVGAGLPQLRGQMGDAKSYAERLFDFPFIGPLSTEAATLALSQAAGRRGRGHHARGAGRVAAPDPGLPVLSAGLGQPHLAGGRSQPHHPGRCDQGQRDRASPRWTKGFFRVRFDRCTPKEKKYLRAMAELGEGPHRSGDIADVLGEKVSSLAPTRSTLIHKGMVWSPNHGDTAFTVPMFGAFMQRILPGEAWRGTEK